MADSTESKPTPAKKSGTVLVRLTSAGVNDTFVIGDPASEDSLTVTPQGVEIDSSKVETLLEIAAYNGVTLTVVEKGE
jgi:hypothetical protein